MPEFFNLLPPGEALRVLLKRLEPAVESELARIEETLRRVTAQEITSPEDLPAFPPFDPGGRVSAASRNAAYGLAAKGAPAVPALRDAMHDRCRGGPCPHRWHLG